MEEEWGGEAWSYANFNLCCQLATLPRVPLELWFGTFPYPPTVTIIILVWLPPLQPHNGGFWKLVSSPFKWMIFHVTFFQGMYHRDDSHQVSQASLSTSRNGWPGHWRVNPTAAGKCACDSYRHHGARVPHHSWESGSIRSEPRSLKIQGILFCRQDERIRIILATWWDGELEASKVKHFHPWRCRCWMKEKTSTIKWLNPKLNILANKIVRNTISATTHSASFALVSRCRAGYGVDCTSRLFKGVSCLTREQEAQASLSTTKIHLYIQVLLFASKQILPGHSLASQWRIRTI